MKKGQSRGISTLASLTAASQPCAAHGEWILRDAESRLPASGLKLTKEVLEGEPAETITRRAAETRSDVIFLGAHGIGHGGGPGGNVGSVAARVLELARPRVRLIR